MSKKLLGTLLALVMMVGAPGSVLAATAVSGDLDLDGLTTSKVDFNRGGSSIYDNGNLHIATDDNLEINTSAGGYALFYGGIQVTGTTTLNGNMTLGNDVADSITATGYFTQARIGTGTTFGNIAAVGADELGVEGAMEVDGAAYLDGAVTASSTLTVTSTTTLNGNVTLGSDAADTITVNGTLGALSPLVFEGATANDYELTITLAAEPTADRVITIPDNTGTLVTTTSGGTMTGTWDFSGAGLTGISSGDLTGTTSTTFSLDTDSTGTVDADLYLYFGDDGNATAHSLKWDDGLGYFILSDGLHLAAASVVDAGGFTVTAGGLIVTAGGATITDGGLNLSSSGEAITNIGVDGTDFSVTGGLTLADALTVTTGGATITAGGLTVTAGGATVTAGGLTVTAGTAQFNDAVILGATSADDMTFNGRVASDFIPKTDNAYDLGASGYQFKNIYINGLAYVDGMGEDLVPSSDAALDLGTASVEWKDLYIDGVAYIDGVGEAFLPVSADNAATTLGSATNEWYQLFLGDQNASLQFGTAQDVTVGWDDGNDALEILGDAVSVGTYANAAIATEAGDLLVADALEVNGNTDLDGDLDVDGTANLDAVDIDLGAAEEVNIDATTTAHTGTGGVVDIDVGAGNAAVDGINLGLTVNDLATGATDYRGIVLTLTANDADADLFGLVISAAATDNAAANSYEAAIFIDSAENTAGTMPDAILITSSGVDAGVTDAIDVSAANITNALNVGANVLLGTTGNINYDLFDMAGDTGKTDWVMAAAGQLTVDAATTDNTTTTGVLDLNLDTVTDGFEGINMDFNVIDDGGIDTLMGMSMTVDNNATTADDVVYGLYIDNEDGAAAADALVYLKNSDTDTAVTDGIFVDTAAGAITDAIDASDAQIVNALNVGANTIIGTTYTLEGTTAIINFEDFDVDADGLMAFTSDGAGDQIAMTGPAQDWQALVVDATTADSTQTAGMIDLNVDTITSTAVGGVSLALAVKDAAGNLTVYGNKTDVTVDTDADQSHTVYGDYIGVTANDATSTTYGLAVQAEDAGGQVMTAGILVNNAQASDIDMTDAILVTATTADSIVDGLDVSAANITNAINIGANAITGTYFGVAATGAVTLTPDAVATVPLTVTGIANSTAVIFDLNLKPVSGTVMDMDVAAATVQAGALLGIDMNFSANITNEAQDQTGVKLTMKDGSASGTAIAVDIDGTVDYGVDLSGITAGTDILLNNSESIANSSDGTITFGRNDTGVVTITAADDDAIAALTIQSGGAAALILDSGGASTVTVGSADVTQINLITDAASTTDVNVTGSITTSTSITATTFVEATTYMTADAYRVTNASALTGATNLDQAAMQAASFWPINTTDAVAVTLNAALAAGDVGRKLTFAVTTTDGSPGALTVVGSASVTVVTLLLNAATAAEDVGDYIECLVVTTATATCVTYAAD